MKPFVCVALIGAIASAAEAEFDYYNALNNNKNNYEFNKYAHESLKDKILRTTTNYYDFVENSHKYSSDSSDYFSDSETHKHSFTHSHLHFSGHHDSSSEDDSSHVDLSTPEELQNVIDSYHYDSYSSVDNIFGLHSYSSHDSHSSYFDDVSLFKESGFSKYEEFLSSIESD